MNDRVPIKPVAGLARTATIPPPPRRRPTAHAAPDPESAATPLAPAQETTAPAAPAKTATRSRPRASDTADVIRSTTLSMPVDVLQALKTRAATERVSQPDVLMDALSATHDQLEQLLDQENPAQDSSGLFVRRSTPESTPLGTLSLRMLARNINAIDDLATTTGAKSRSALCTAALRQYLKT